MSRPVATIDDRPVPVQEGDTVLAAARRAGIAIPALCHVPGAAPIGWCRLCLVEIVGEARPAAACHAALRPGMVVRTASPRLARLRHDLLRLVATAHPEATDGAAFRALLDAHGVDAPRRPGAPAATTPDHPYLRLDVDACIGCHACVAACDEIQGRSVHRLAGRGAASRVVVGIDGFGASRCTACGRCVDACPTGAIFDVDRANDAPTPEATVDSVCAYCGVGCRVRIGVRADRVVRMDGVPDAAVNHGHLCVKGRYAHAYHHAADRLRRPLRREADGRFVEIGWDEAFDFAATRLRAVRDAHGPDALGVLTSSRSTNEAAYLLQKLFRAVLGTNNVDCCARVCHSSTALALSLATGTGAASASYADIERAPCIVVAGANATEAHPVVGARLLRRARHGAPLVVIDPRRIELAEAATVHLMLRPGTNVALFDALARALMDEGLVDLADVEARTEGWPELAAHLSRTSVEANAEIAGVDAARVRDAARLLGDGALFVSGLGLSEGVQGTASVLGLTNLGMLTGSIGRPGRGMLPLRGQNNVQGNADMGAMPDRLTGYQRLDDPAVRERAERIWGVAPPTAPGLTVPEMFDAAVAGGIRGLWIQGEDVLQSDPHEAHVRAALERLDLLIVQEIFMSETARLAHLVLPAAAAVEQDGTFTNGERRIQRVRAAVPAPGAARPDWTVARDVAARLGAAWSYDDDGDVLAEIAAIAPALFGGVRVERLGPDGLQWPCPTLDHPGTATVHAEGFVRGRGRLSVLEFAASPEHDVPGHPYTLVTGRVLEHYNVGTMTRRTANAELVPADRLEIHPDDAAREGIGDGAIVEVSSRWGATRVPALLSPRIARGTLFLSFHFPESHTNRLVGPHVDPQSKCPDYKVTAVRLRVAPLTARSGPAAT